jgi:hypothetical protein
VNGQLLYAGKLSKVLGEARSTKVASGTARLTGAGKKGLKLKFTSKARKSLKRKRSVKLTLQLSVADSSGNRTTKTKKITLKR